MVDVLVYLVMESSVKTNAKLQMDEFDMICLPPLPPRSPPRPRGAEPPLPPPPPRPPPLPPLDVKAILNVYISDRSRMVFLGIMEVMCLFFFGGVFLGEQGQVFQSEPLLLSRKMCEPRLLLVSHFS